MSSNSLIPSISRLIIVFILVGHCWGQLKVGFYKGKCGENDVEEIIHQVIQKKIAADPHTVAHLIRLSFHDCFVRGCDGSVFLDGENTEKTSAPNKDVGGFNIIDDVKAAVEKLCPEVVSCADVLVIATRAAISLAGGKWYAVETGRRDSLVSISSEALANIPPPTIPIPQAIDLFGKKGLSKDDFVLLLGGHTVGMTHCHSFKERLYNFRNTNKPDPIMSSSLLQQLRTTCPQNSTSDGEAFLDQSPNSHFIVDNGYFKQITAHNGTMEIDQSVALHPMTRVRVQGLASSPSQFSDQFGLAIVNMSRIGVLTGNQGEIRKTCGSTNEKMVGLSGVPGARSSFVSSHASSPIHAFVRPTEDRPNSWLLTFCMCNPIAVGFVLIHFAFLA